MQERSLMQIDKVLSTKPVYPVPSVQIVGTGRRKVSRKTQRRGWGEWTKEPPPCLFPSSPPPPPTPPLFFVPYSPFRATLHHLDARNRLSEVEGRGR